jgi:hypothetical protein
MSLQLATWISGGTAVAVVLALLFARKRLGALNTASWLVIWGAVVAGGEHSFFAISYTLPLPSVAEEGPMTLLPHARIHFFMSGIYAIIGLVMLGVIARTLLREGRAIGWFAILFALIVGGTFDLVMGALWFTHGSPLYRLVGIPVHPHGFGWEFLYVYFLAWIAALTISYKPIFAKPPA